MDFATINTQTLVEFLSTISASKINHAYKTICSVEDIMAWHCTTDNETVLATYAKKKVIIMHKDKYSNSKGATKIIELMDDYFIAMVVGVDSPQGLVSVAKALVDIITESRCGVAADPFRHKFIISYDGENAKVQLTNLS